MDSKIDMQPSDLELKELDEKLAASQKLLRESKFEEAIESYRVCCEKARDLFKDEMHPKMARFCYSYGNAVLYKIEESGELFGEVIEKAENVEGEEAAEDKPLEKDPSFPIIVDETNINPGQNPQDQPLSQNPQDQPLNTEFQAITIEPQDKPEEKITEEVDFLQIAWENLEVARVITEKRSKEMLDEPTFDKSEFENVLRLLARIHLRLGDLECWKENFTDGLTEYQKSLDISRKFENPALSRDISELHFLIGNAHLYIGKDDCEDEALKAYNEARVIMENNLKKALGVPFDSGDVFCQTVPFDKSLMNPSSLDSEAAAELKSTLKMLCDKIEDTAQQKAEKALYKIEKEKMKENSVIENSFGVSQPQPESRNVCQNDKENIIEGFHGVPPKDKEEVKIVNLGVFGNSRKRPAPVQSEQGIQGKSKSEGTEGLMPEDKKMKMNE